jgi:hypothetical protein
LVNFYAVFLGGYCIIKICVKMLLSITYNRGIAKHIVRSLGHERRKEDGERTGKCSLDKLWKKDAQKSSSV